MYIGIDDKPIINGLYGIPLLIELVILHIDSGESPTKGVDGISMKSVLVSALSCITHAIISPPYV